QSQRRGRSPKRCPATLSRNRNRQPYHESSAGGGLDTRRGTCPEGRGPGKERGPLGRCRDVLPPGVYSSSVLRVLRARVAFVVLALPVTGSPALALGVTGLLLGGCGGESTPPIEQVHAAPGATGPGEGACPAVADAPAALPGVHEEERT